MIISNSQQISGDLIDFIQTKIPQDQGNIILKSVEFYTTLGQSNDPKLVQVKGIQQGYPLYGELAIEYLTVILVGTDEIREMIRRKKLRPYKVSISTRKPTILSINLDPFN